MDFSILNSTVTTEDYEIGDGNFSIQDFVNCSSEFNSSYLNETNCTMTNNPQSSLHVIANIILQLFHGIAFIVGLIGNFLVIYVILRFSKMQTVTNLYILNLAIADELFVIGIPFLMITTWMGNWAFGNPMCKLYMIVTSLNQFTSSLFLTIMSADRYIAVCHPISSPRFRTSFISRVVSSIAWTISSLMILPVIIYSKAFLADGVLTCNIDWSLNVHTIFTVYAFVIAFGIPVFLFLIFYSLVLLKLRGAGPNTRSREKKKTHRKVTKMVLTVITVYVFCYLPYWVLQITLIYSPPKQVQSPLMLVFFLFSSCLSYANSAINPILYAFLSENFKKSFKKACSCSSRSEVNNLLQFDTSFFSRRYRRESSRLSRRELKERKLSSNPGTSQREHTMTTKVALTPNLGPVIHEEMEVQEELIMSTQL